MRFFILLMIGFLMTACETKQQGNSKMLVYIGTYTENDSQGIEIYRFNTQSGKLQYFATAAGIKNPSYLRISDDGRRLYAVNELTEFHGLAQGAITSFAIDPESGKLNLINQIPSHGQAPCYLELSKNEHFVLANNYLGGTAISVPILPNGSLGDPVSIIRFKGSGPVKGRQEASHVHSINLNPQNTFAIVADLGSDQLSVLRFDSVKGSLQILQEKTVCLSPGSGPRHVAFSKDGKFVYVANELNSTVDAFLFDPASGSMEHLQTLRTIPQDFSRKNYPADIHLSPDGQFLYLSNRGHESIAIFRVDQKSGLLKRSAEVPVYGSWPRNFTLSAKGKWLIVANQKSKNLVVFKRNAQDGLLEKRWEIHTKATPACVKIMP